MSTAAGTASGVGLVPRWALLSGIDRPIVEALLALTPRNSFGLVVLEDVIQLVATRGFDRMESMKRLQMLIENDWIHRTPTEGEPGKDSIGKSIFLYEYGWLSPFALELIPLAGR